jgi:hypothetical protein
MRKLPRWSSCCDFGFAFLQVGTLAVSEFFPFMLVLDWSVIGVLLLGDEGERINS